MQALAATFRCADRALVNVASQLAGVFDNSALDVALAHHDLEGSDLPTEWPDPDEDAGLSVQERLDLARQLIARSTPPGHHVVWITYGNARFEPWRFEMGPVTFYDGPAMLGCFHHMREDPAAGRSAGLAVDGRPFGLPPEFLHPERGESLRDKRDWPNEEHWVAARIDLGRERYSDPIRAAPDEADALVHLAAFHNGRTGWRPFQGHLHIVDDVLRSSSGPFEDPGNRDNCIALDHTDEALHDLHDDLEPHLPVDDPALHELINAAAVLNTAASSDDSAGLLQSVRIIELIATRCDIGWQTFLTDYLATRWAQAEIHDDIYQSVADLNNDYELREHFPELDAIYGRLVSDDRSRPPGRDHPSRRRTRFTTRTRRQTPGPRPALQNGADHPSPHPDHRGDRCMGLRPRRRIRPPGPATPTLSQLSCSRRPDQRRDRSNRRTIRPQPSPRRYGCRALGRLLRPGRQRHPRRLPRPQAAMARRHLDRKHGHEGCLRAQLRAKPFRSLRKHRAVPVARPLPASCRRAAGAPSCEGDPFP